MSRFARLLLIAVPLAGVIALAAWLLLRDPPPSEPTPDSPGHSPGTLVVLIVFDQMRGDYLERFAAGFGPDGFERIKKDGVWFSAAHLPYSCTSTGPGHASIVTGAPPSASGIIENEWYDRAAAKLVYCAQPEKEQPLVPAITGGKPERGSDLGFSPERLLPGVTTVGEALKESSAGKSRVICLSIKDRTVAMMGGRQPHAADGAYCFDTRDGQFHTSTYYRDTPHAWVEEFNKARRVDTWFGSNWDRLEPVALYDQLAGPDRATGEAEGVARKQGVVFPHPMSAGLTTVGKDYFATVEVSPFGNELLFELAKKAIASEQLGSRGGTDLLCISFSSNDLIGHAWGPDSHEVMDATLRSDRLIAALLKQLDASHPGRHVVVITSDHGVCPIPDQHRYPKLFPAATRVTLPEVLVPLGAALDDRFGPGVAGPTRWLEATDFADNLWPWVYLNRKAIAARGSGSERTFDDACEFAAQWLGNRPFMLTAFTRQQIESNTMPSVPGAREAEVRAAFDKVKLAYHPARCGDIIGIVKPGVQVGKYTTGTGHGSVHAYDTHVPVLAYGARIPPVGKIAEPRSALIVAPIVSHGLGITPPASAIEKLPVEIAGGK